MRKTIFRQFLFYMILFGLFLSVASWLVIEFFFDDYYYMQQKKILISHTETLVNEYAASGLNGLQALIGEYSIDVGMSVHFLDIKTGTVYGSDLQGSGKQGLMAALNHKTPGEIFISKTETQNNQKDWLSYILNTNDGNLILGRISYSSMDSVVGLVQNFLFVFGLSIAAIFILFAYIFSKSMSRPLKALNTIAKKMGQLDFSLKYEGNRIDEIGMLGKTLNEITSKLENTISQLQGELSKERTLDKMRTQFTAQVSHELQTPLSVIKGYSEALSDQIYSSEESFEVYEILLAETLKISHMVDDLLDLSQMESGAYIIRKGNFPIVQLLYKLFERHKNLPNDKSFNMVFDNACAEDSIYSGDSVRIEQAVRNILSNAIKHVSSGGLIKLKLEKINSTYAVSIYNTGINIPDEDVPYIFDSYYQGKNHHAGTGLGLAISKHIIELHNGKISVLNNSGGVTFKLLLP